MPGEWQRQTLRDAGVSVLDCEHRTPQATKTGFPYVTIPELRDGRIDVSSARRIAAADFDEWTRRARPRAWDVVLSRRTNPGETAFVPDGLDFALGQNLVLLRSSGTAVIPPYLRWLVRGPDWWRQIAKFLNVGAVFDSLKVADIPNFVLPIPPLDEQRSIARVLGALDDKIDLNRQMNQTLEATARALFKSWFVDFDPVRAKAEGTDPRLPQAIADLLPDSFEVSDIGEIPVGWHTGRLADIAEHPRRGVQPDEIDSATPYIALEHMPRHSIALAHWTTADGVASGKFQFKLGEILFGKLRPYFHKVGVAPLDGVCSTDVVVLSPWAHEYFCIVLGIVSSDAFVEFTSAGATGTKMPRTSWAEMGRYRLAIPPQAVAGAFNDSVRPLIDRIIASIHECRTLAAIRDTLLPKLISGEIRVPQAERMLKAAAI